MKTLCCVLAFSFAALSTFGQGCLVFQNGGMGREQFVYGLDPANPTSDVLEGIREKLSGPGYSAQIFWAEADSSEADLKALEGSQTSFKTGNLAGLLLGFSKLCIPGTFGGTKVNLQMRVWDNQGGSLTSWAGVIMDNAVARGMSQILSNWELSGLDAENGPHLGSGNLKYRLRSFGLYLVPEPSVIAISTLGFCALLLRRPDSG